MLSGFLQDLKYKGYFRIKRQIWSLEYIEFRNIESGRDRTEKMKPEKNNLVSFDNNNL